MKNKKQNEGKAEEIVERAKDRNSFRGEIKARAITQTPCFSGKINRLGDISVEYNPYYPLHEIPKTRLTEPEFDSALEAVIEHEICHKEDSSGRGCPRNEQDDLHKILIPISRVLKRKNFPNIPFGHQGHTLYSYFANIFEDFIDNVVASDNIGSRGFFLVYDDMAQHSDGLTELYEAFVKLQARVFPRKQGISLMLRHFKQSQKTREVVKKYLERTKIMDIPKDKRIGFLTDRENWQALSEIFADEFSKLVDLKNLSACYFPLFGQNDFSKLNDEDFQMRVAIKAYEESRDKFQPPEFMDDNLALLSVYRQLAKKIEMKVNSYSVETRRPITHVSRRKFDFEKDPLERLQFGLSEEGKLEAQITRYPIEVRSRYQISAGTIPEVRIGYMDCSSSTRESVKDKKGRVMNPWAPEERQWTDTSIYHNELLSFFGLCELFRRRGTLKNSNVRLGIFSDSTRIAKDLTESEKFALQPAFGNTYFDEDALSEIFKGQGSLVYTISDGEVANWNILKEKFIERAKKHHYFHLQIGRENQMYKDIKAAGLNAILDSEENSAKILIDLTQNQIYGVK